MRHHWNDKTKPFVYILRMLHIVCKKWLAVSQTLSIFFQSLFNNIILLWRPIAEYGQSNEPLAHAVLTASIQSYLLWSTDREGGFRMTVGPGGSQLLYLVCLLIRGPLYCNQNTAEQLRNSIKFVLKCFIQCKWPFAYCWSVFQYFEVLLVNYLAVVGSKLGCSTVIWLRKLSLAKML